MELCAYHPSKKASITCEVCKLDVCISDRQYYWVNQGSPNASRLTCCKPCFYDLKIEEIRSEPGWKWITRVLISISGICIFFMLFFYFQALINPYVTRQYSIWMIILFPLIAFGGGAAMFAYAAHQTKYRPNDTRFTRDLKMEFLEKAETVPDISLRDKPKEVIEPKRPKSTFQNNLQKARAWWTSLFHGKSI